MAVADRAGDVAITVGVVRLALDHDLLPVVVHLAGIVGGVLGDPLLDGAGEGVGDRIAPRAALEGIGEEASGEEEEDAAQKEDLGQIDAVAT